MSLVADKDRNVRPTYRKHKERKHKERSEVNNKQKNTSAQKIERESRKENIYVNMNRNFWRLIATIQLN